MKYIIMLAIVLGLAIVDFITGIFKAYIKHDLSSTKMRKGGINKLTEMLIMSTACGLELGIKMLGRYYHSAELARVAGAVAAGAVFVYIVIMEVISILENYGAINPKAKWVKALTQKLRNFNSEKGE